MGKEIGYREILNGEEAAVCKMIEESFNEFIAPGYGQEGRIEFLKYLNPKFMQFRLAHNHFILVAYVNELAGTIEVRNNNHISLLFVKKEYLKRGIAKHLFDQAVEKCKLQRPEVDIIEVNSSPFAVPVYEKLGFSKITSEQIVNGMRFTPMTMKLN